MTSLRRRMIEDMRLAGLAEGTQQTYVRAIVRLAGVYKQSPEILTEEQVATYLRDMSTKEQAARGTFQVARAAIRFLFGNTLQRDWALLKKRCGCPNRSACRRFWRVTVLAVCWAKSTIRAIVSV